MRYDDSIAALRMHRKPKLLAIQTLHRFNRDLYRQTLGQLVRAIYELQRAHLSQYRFITRRRY